MEFCQESLPPPKISLSGEENIARSGAESVVPRETWRGQFHAGTLPTTGAVRDCPIGVQTNCLQINWPGMQTNASHAWGGEQPDIRVWYGGLVDGMRDASGQMYMRNRYYDPATGQFTQTDPIGIAGGMNVYGFAGGDPVTYSDPYGLDCMDRNGNRRPCRVTWSVADRPNRNVNPRALQVIQEIADRAEVDLQLSSGLRPGDRGNHGTGRGIDVNEINGIDIGTGKVANPDALSLVEHVQNVAREHSEVRENFGPAGLWKSPARGSPQTNYQNGTAARRKLQEDHNNHIHISVQP